MSLVLWMPCLGNIKDQGTVGINPAGSFTAVAADSKLGSCIKTTSSSTINTYLPFDKWNFTKNSVSICGWFKFNKSEISEAVSNYSYTSTFPYSTGTLLGYAYYGGFAICWRSNTMYSEGFSQLYMFSNLRTNDLYYDCGAIQIAFDTWYHYTTVYDKANDVIRVYVNGDLIDQVNVGSITSSTYSNSPTVCVNGDFVMGGNGPGKNIPYYCNDLRVYNHALSTSEIKELSRGLVLHYKFNDGCLEPTTNFFNGNGENFENWSSYGFGSCGIKSYDSSVPALCGQTCRVTSNGSDSSNQYIEMATWASGNSLQQGEKVTLSAYVKGVGNTIGKTCFIHIYNHNGTHVQSDTVASTTLTSEWQRISGQFTWNYEDASSESYSCYVVAAILKDEYFLFSNVQLEFKDHVTPYTKTSRVGTEVQDSSGYNLNGTSIGSNIAVLSASRRNNNYSALSDGTGINIGTTNGALGFVTSGTVAFWARYDTSSSYKMVLTNVANTGHWLAAWTNDSEGWYHASVGSVTNYCDGVPYNNPKRDGRWHHYAFTGVDFSAWSSGMTNISNYGGGKSGGFNFHGDCSDFRIYNTVLSAEDIKELYEKSASIDKSGNIVNYLEDESYYNILSNEDYGIASKKWLGGLSGYTQSHCSCTLTDDGYRIYRDPNLTVSNDGYVMWGGFVVDNWNNRFGFQKGHAYILQFEVKGQTSNGVCDIYWSNQVGWGGGETAPNPSNIIINNPVTENYNSQEWKTFTYKWTINDDIYKTCTANYNSDSFIAGQTYVSYRGFKYGFSYYDTGSLGTDLYIRNIRMFDITNNQNTQIFKSGVVRSISFTEEDVKSNITPGGVVVNQLIEK